MKRVLLWILGIVAVLAAAAFVLLGRIDTQFMVSRIAEATARATGHPPASRQRAGCLSLLPPGVTFGQARWGDIADGRGACRIRQGRSRRIGIGPAFFRQTGCQRSAS